MDQIKMSDMLLVSYYMPGRHHGGGLRLLDLYACVKALFPERRIDLAVCIHPGDEVPAILYDLFDHVYLISPVDFHAGSDSVLSLADHGYGVIDLQYLQSGELVGAFRRRAHGKIIFSPMESMLRAFFIDLGAFFKSQSRRRFGDLWDSGRYAVRELMCAWRASAVLCVSESDARVLRKLCPASRVRALETGVSPLEFPDALTNPHWLRRIDDVRRVVFVAYFGSDTNRDALRWYLDEVHPSVKRAVPDYVFEIIGAGTGALDFRLPEGVVLTGRVESVEQAIKGAWVGIAPALSGAGLRGKVNQYAIAGVPCVASEITGRDFAYQPGRSIFLAGDAAQFASECIRLLESVEENRRAGQMARDVCLERYSWESRSPALREIFSA